MMLRQFWTWLRLPVSIKIRVIRLLFCRALKRPCQKHDIIWGSVFLYASEHKLNVLANNGAYQLELIYKDRPLAVGVRGHLSSDVFTFFQLFVTEEYTPFFQRVGRYDIKSIIDCGANVGYFSVQALTWFPQAKVLLVEPDLENLNQIETNLTRNNLDKSCELVHGAIWSTHQYLEINDSGEEWAYQVHPAESVTSLRGFTLLKLMQIAGYDRIDILKLDVEGNRRAFI